MKLPAWTSTPLGSGYQLAIGQEGAEGPIRCFLLKEPARREGELPLWTWRMRPPLGEGTEGKTRSSLKEASTLSQASAIEWLRQAPAYQVLSLFSDEPVPVVVQLEITYATMAQLLDPADPLELSQDQRTRVIRLLGGKRSEEGADWVFADPPREQAIESEGG